ncbi:DODA-type extradiol aromatic ring-opening family dioxygenase [Iodobacter arcticus]|uniref:DODA-type extradiol aromatic ring-opening family dioxygenase n=1 Tax=Iodobacter arcticus TaxID=590593 RepID=A0ABW2QWY1_9NEIS
MFPSFYISHGSPMLALDAGKAGLAWQALVADLPKPKAILMVSAHWGSLRPAVGAASQPETIHDFGGFPAALFELQYPAPGAPWLAEKVAAVLEAAGLPVAIHPSRGLDHGAWVPLRVMYPDADVPVVQLSIQPRQGPEHHYRLGQALAGLQQEGVMIIGSGSLTHNLYEVMGDITEGDPRVPAYVPAFQAWMNEKLLANDINALLDYRRQAPEASRAHPTDEHLLPIFVVMGVAQGGKVERSHSGITGGVLAMDVYRWQD